MDLEAAIIASRFITLRWSPPQTSKEPILGYSIFYKQENSERERVLNSTKGNLEEVNVQGLSPGASYLFRVVALNQHGAGTTSSTLRVSTQPDLGMNSHKMSIITILCQENFHTKFIPKFEIFHEKN